MPGSDAGNKVREANETTEKAMALLAKTYEKNEDLKRCLTWIGRWTKVRNDR